MQSESRTDASRNRLGRASAGDETRAAASGLRAPVLSLRTPRRTRADSDSCSGFRVEKLSDSRFWPFNLHLRRRRGVGREASLATTLGDFEKSLTARKKKIGRASCRERV